MLYWLKFFLLSFIATFMTLLYVNSSILVLLFHSELLILNLIFLFFTIAMTFNFNFFMGLAFCYLIFGGMEIALNLLLLIM